jgi:two-component system, sensor histidine kinase and response regulator
MFAEAPLGMVLLDSRLFILAANSRFLRLSGIKKAAGIDFTSFFVKEEAKDLRFFFESFRRDGEGAGIWEARRSRVRGVEIWWRVHVSLLNDAKKFTVIVEDISDQKAFEESLKAAKESSEKAQAVAERETRTKSDFLANMSHEIRTPIHTIIGMTELLIDTALDAEQQEYVEQVQFSADVLLSLINDILDFSKIEAGKLSIENIDFDLYKTTEDAVDLVALEAHKKGLETAVFIENDVPHQLKGDPVRLRQIIVNLFNNSVKFTESGEVMVRVEKLSREKDSILIKFSVRDTGIGIPKDKKNRLFKVFSQVDSSTTRKFGGTGLGLSISKNLSEMMGGEIGVESEYGKGSTFWFTVRFEVQEEPSFYHALPDGYFSAKVLVVDDNVTIREMLVNYLKEWGLEVDTAADGREGLALLRSRHEEGISFDVCLVDLLLPGMDGWQFASEVNADTELYETRLVLMSPTGKSGDEAKMKLLHWFEAYISKPVKKGKLFELLFSLFNIEAEAEPVEETEESVELVEEITGGRILVAEDHEVNQQLFKTILQNIGHEVHLANNGREAVQAAKGIPYDIIFMDVQMPEMNGYEATKEIRSLGIDTPIIAVTASALRGEEAKSLEVGMNDFLVKPFKKRDLEPVLEKWFQESRKSGTGDATAADAAEPADLEELSELEEVEELEEVQENEAAEEPVGGTGMSEMKSAYPDEPIFNFDAAVETFMGKADVVKKVLTGHVAKIDGQIAKLREAVGAGDMEKVRAEAHAIKGGSLNLEIRRLGLTAADLEKAGADGDTEAAARFLTLLEFEFEEFKKVYEERFADGETAH